MTERDDLLRRVAGIDPYPNDRPLPTDLGDARPPVAILIQGGDDVDRASPLTPARGARWWRGPAVAVAAFVVALLVAIPIFLVTRLDVPAEETPSPTTTVIGPAGTWNPVLATTRAKPAPPAASCPPGTDPNTPGPVDQVRPANEETSIVPAVFDRHAGRVVYVNALGETWTFDVCTNTWYQMHPTGTAPDDLNGGLVYDVDSDVTVAFGWEHISVYDANTNTWTHPANDRLGYDTDQITPYGGAYDPVSGLIITSAFRRSSETNSDSWEFWAYDVDTNEWTLLGPLRWEPSNEGQFDFLGYSEQLDRLIVTGWVYAEAETMLVDPRTGDVTVLPIESPSIDIVFWSVGTYGAAGGTVYAATMTLDTPHDICGFDANVKSWTACFDVPNDADIGPLVGDPVNNRLILLNAGPWSGTILNGIRAIDLDTGEWTQILAPSPIAYPPTP